LRALWLLYAIVSLADLTLTCLYLSPELEANPIASWIWSKFGYLGIVSFKFLVLLCIVYPICRMIQKKNPLAAKIVISLGIFFTLVACILFGVYYI
tara:strand:+ start:83 stop:370 length:288 start_codon:yes stop_codon:yes gene_type:complete